MRIASILCRLGLVLLSMSSPSIASARVQSEFPYAPDRVWNTAMRLVRVDLGCTLGDRDQEIGFFMFQYPEGSRRYPGSIELVPTRVQGREGVRVVVQIPNLPSYVERMIVDRLGRKLFEDHGNPPPARPEPSRDRERQPEAPPQPTEPAQPPAHVDENGDPTEPVEPSE